MATQILNSSVVAAGGGLQRLADLELQVNAAFGAKLDGKVEISGDMSQAMHGIKKVLRTFL